MRYSKAIEIALGIIRLNRHSVRAQLAFAGCTIRACMLVPKNSASQ